MRVAAFVGQAQVYRGALAALAVARQLGVLEVHALVGVEVGVDLVGGHHTGQRGDIGGDDVAGGELGAADTATDGRGDAGEAEVQACQVELGLDRIDAGTGFGGGTAARFGQFGGDGVAVTQALATAGFVGAADGGGLGLLQLGFKAADFSLERARVDLEQQVAFLDLGAFGEGDLVDLAGDPRAHFDGFRGFEAAGELVPFGDRLFDHLGHTYLRRGGSLHGVGGSTASADHHHCQGSEGEAQGFE
ncbi:hypothetical protein D9M71_564200 [compost metagenome]